MQNFKVLKDTAAQNDKGLESIIKKISRVINTKLMIDQFKIDHKHHVNSAYLEAFDNITGIYFAGGAVRDIILNRAESIKDLDIYVMVKPEYYNSSLKSVSEVDPKKVVPSDKQDEMDHVLDRHKYYGDAANYQENFQKVNVIAKKYIDWVIFCLHEVTRNDPSGVIYSRNWQVSSIQPDKNINEIKYDRKKFAGKSKYDPSVHNYSFLHYSLDSRPVPCSSMCMYGDHGERIFNKVFKFLSDTGPANYDKAYDIAYSLALDVISRLLVNCEPEVRRKFLKGKRSKNYMRCVEALISSYKAIVPDNGISDRYLRDELMYLHRLVLNTKSFFTNQKKQIQEYTVHTNHGMAIIKNVVGTNLEHAIHTKMAMRELFGMTAMTSHIAKSYIVFSDRFYDSSTDARCIDIDMMLIPDFDGDGSMSSYIERFFDMSLSKCYVEDGKARYSDSFLHTLETNKVVYESSRTDLLMKRNIMHTSRIMKKLGYSEMTIDSKTVGTQFLVPKNNEIDEFMTKMFLNYITYLQVQEEEKRLALTTKKSSGSESVDSSGFVI